MSDIAIRVEKLGKQYQIGGRPAAATLREALHGALRAPWRRDPTRRRDFWALQDVSFEVERGEVVGVIGANGAGKSTLLKILSRITEPTRGRVEMRGRVGSLLEVGTGFHPELSGRENIYLNGAILGMRRREIAARFDEIVAFAELAEFIDMPVKRYSTGMYLRLAFAVAAHLEPEILLVDEVLAVGDARFQRRCLGKMGEVARAGRTVLLVSHNMAAVANLCRHALLLEQGRIVYQGDAQTAVLRHLQTSAPGDQAGGLNLRHRSGSGPLRFTSFRCADDAGNPIPRLISGQTCRFLIGYTMESPLPAPGNMPVGEVSLVISLPDGANLVNLSTYFFPDALAGGLAVPGELECCVPHFPLRFGRYTVDLYCAINHEISDYVRAAASFEVHDGDFYGTGRLTRAESGAVLLPHTWRVASPPLS
ncbi:MAG: hypothetical protein Fur0021_13720 [Candidatus Promineifilaceae bacterium]